MKYRRLYEDALIIAPREDWPFFFKYRHEYPLASFSLMSEEDLEGLFDDHYDDRAVIYLLKKGYSVELALDCLEAMTCRFLRKGLSKKIDDLVDLKKELSEQGLLFCDAYPEKTLENKTIIIHGYHDGGRISLALEDSVEISICFDNVFSSQEDGSLPELHEFSDIYGELHYVFNRICNLIDSGVSPDDIYLAGADASYDFLLPLYAEAYGIGLESNSMRTLADSPLSRFFLGKLAEMSLDEALSATQEKFPDDPDFQSLSLLSKRYEISEFSKEKQKKTYLDVFATKMAKHGKLKNAVKMLHSYHAPFDSHVFFLSFSLNNAPHCFKDTDYLSDQEKGELYLPGSLDLAREEKADLIALLYSGNVDCLSFKERSLGNEYYSSPLTLELPFKKDKDIELPYEYSESFSKLWCSSLLDVYKKYLRHDERIEFLDEKLKPGYRLYDPSYIPFAAFPEDKVFNHSYSSISTFYECQFHYYCERILKLSGDQTFFAAKLGTMFHQVLQRMREPGFSFDKEWEQAYEDIESNPDNGPFTSKERVLLIRLHDELLSTVDMLAKHESHMDHPVFDPEYGFKYPMSISSFLVGSIDKVVRTGENGRYFSIIDYKTGSTDFDQSLIEFGLSLQLPVYAYIALHDPHFEGSELIGLFIDHILAKKLVKAQGVDYDSFKNKQLLLKGVYTDDVEKLKTFEPDYHESSFISGLKYTDGKGFGRGSSPKSQEELEGFANLAEEKIKQADASIRAYDFKVNPKLLKGKVNSCDYCPFKDVCYVRDSSRVLLIRKKEEEGTDNGEA